MKKPEGRKQDHQDSSNNGILERELDYLCLIISSFFLNDLVDGDNHLLAQPNPSLLWLYFTSRGLRNCMYLGMACRVGFNALFRVGNRGFTARNCFFVGLFSYTAVRNIAWSLKSVRRERSGGSRSASSMLGNWFTQGHAGGSWFLGAGNGEWYGFVGHNSPEETQVLPQMLLDQMKMKRADDPRFPEREDGESKYPENNTDPTSSKVEEIFETSSS